VRFGYLAAPWLIRKEIDASFDLSEEQQTLVQQVVREQLDRTARDMFPKYAALVREQGALVAQGVWNSEAVHKAGDRGLELFRETFRPMLPVFADFLAKIDDRQIAIFSERLDRANKELSERAGRDEARRRKHRYETYARRFETWSGNLESEQRIALEKDLQELVPVEDLQIAHRRKVLGELLAALRAHDRARVLAHMERELLTPEKSRSPEYHAAFERNRLVSAAAYARLAASLTEKQKKKVLKNATSVADDLEAISREAATKK
jgi:hypothetical protein